MEAKAILRTARISPQKARLVADQVRGMPASRAHELLKFSDKKAAHMIGKVLWDEFFLNSDWPLAAAVAVCLLVLLVGPMMLFQRQQARSLERG